MAGNDYLLWAGVAGGVVLLLILAKLVAAPGPAAAAPDEDEGVYGRDRRRPQPGPRPQPEPEPAPAPAGGGDLDQILAEVQRGRKIHAIKRYRELYGVGLKEAKEAVDALAAGLQHRSPAPLSPGDLTEVRAALARGKKIQAIKLYRELTGVGLKEAKDAVEAL